MTSRRYYYKDKVKINREMEKEMHPKTKVLAIKMENKISNNSKKSKVLTFMKKMVSVT